MNSEENKIGKFLITISERLKGGDGFLRGNDIHAVS